MIGFLARRLLELAGTLAVASFLVFGAVYLAPGRPETFLLGGRGASPQLLAAIRSQYHLDDPFLVQYGRWLGDVLTGRFGESVQYRSSVLALVGSRLPTTATLIGMSLVLVLVFGIGLGWLGAVRGGVADSGVLVGTSLALGTPSFVAGVVMQSYLAIKLHWFPDQGSGTGFADLVYHLVLPSIALSLYWIGMLARVTRTAMLDVLGQEHVMVARSRGVPEAQVLRRHVFRNALGPIVTTAGLIVTGLVISTVLVEAVFTLNGVGAFLEKSVTVKDFPVVQAIALLIVAVFVLVNLVVDLLYPFIDPRVALGAREGGA
ncbi:ABC transporter permease [Actinomadura oligospora]|uniref:ABC transporter permease n=1 Tax=Actinomadura oligospora TaxID=111804 RepID=UPI00047DE341|nr:ABC transporter permease [Actinomadura oligospora]